MNRHLLGMIIFIFSFMYLIIGIVTFDYTVMAVTGIGLLIGGLLISFSDGLQRRLVSRTMQRYTPEVKYSAEDKGYIATFAEFPHLSAFGDTKAEAVSELNVVLDATIEVYEDEGWELPQPRADAIRALKGKYSHVNTSADEFTKRKYMHDVAPPLTDEDMQRAQESARNLGIKSDGEDGK